MEEKGGRGEGKRRRKGRIRKQGKIEEKGGDGERREDVREEGNGE